MKENIKPATGRLGVLVVGVGGAVATTMITGTLAARKGLAKAIGSITQMAAMRMQDGKEKLIKDIVPLADLNDIIFGGWDIFPDNAYEAAMYAEVLKSSCVRISVTSRQPITASVLLCCGLQVPKYIFLCPRSTNLSLLWNRQ